MSNKWKSSPTKRDERYTPRYYVFAFRGDESERVETQTLTTESAAMKVANEVFNSDDTVTAAHIIESRAIRAYHRHIYTDNNPFCTRCWERKS